MHPSQLSIQDYTYTLPEEKIAIYPLEERDQSKLLIYDNGNIDTDIYRNISQHLSSNAQLVFNNTKVIEARILFQKSTGGVIEIFCLEPHGQYPDITVAMAQQGKVLWYCLVGGASKWKPGQILEKKIDNVTLYAKYAGKENNQFIIELSWEPSELSFAEILHHTGAIPLPPYIKREPGEADKQRYQTVYARTDGSVAAPTAGLHFTEKIFHDLDAIGITRSFVTLHVGAGTFKPVKSDTMAEHDMHAEWIDVTKDFIQQLTSNIEKDIIAVGTTSLRTLESLYWIGKKFLDHPTLINDQNAPEVSQWEPYDQGNQYPLEKTLSSILDWMKKHNLERLVTKTQILIAPGYNFKIVKGLITNFHQPQSTLLLLVAAFIGEDWRKVYSYALENNFRFLSYGDGCLIWRNAK